MFRTALATTAITTLLATGASAATMTIVYDGQGTPLVNQSIGVDLVGGGDDYGSGDGINDINLGENPGSGDTSGRFSVDSRTLDFDTNIFQSGDLARNANNELILFSEGDEINDTHFLGSQDTAILYGGVGLGGFPEAPLGILPNEGDSVILGFRFQITQASQTFSDEVSLLDIAYEEDFDEGCEEGLDDGETCGGSEELIATYFGFIEITRGSVIPGTLGFNNVSGEAAVVSIPDIAPVPLPAAGWMLIAGVGGLIAAGRRKHA